MVELPSFSRWLTSHPIMWQINFSIMMKFSPIFIFLWGNALLKGLGYPQETALVLPGMAGCAALVFYMYWDFGNRNASTAALPLNMTATWNATKTEDIYTNIIDFTPLNEDPKNGPFSYGVKFDMPQKDDKGGEFQHAIFVTKYPFDKAFRRIPRQIVALGGSVFDGMAARIVATYANEYEDLRGYSPEDMVMDQFKIFHVKWCVEDSKADQIKLGLYQEDPITKEIVTQAVQLEIDRKATRLGMRLRESEGQLHSFSEAYQDAETRGWKIVNRLIDDMDRIKKERSLITRLMRDKWARLIMVGILLAAVAYVARYYKVI